MTVTLIVLVATAGLMVWGKIRSDIVALCSLLALIITGILTPDEALAGFSNPVVIMIAALFIVGGAISQTGLASMISNNILKFAGDSNYKPIEPTSTRSSKTEMMEIGAERDEAKPLLIDNMKLPPMDFKKMK